VLDLDAGDFLERLGQRLRFVLMRRDGFGDDRNFLDAFTLQFFGSINEPLHLGELFFLAQRRRLELGIDPFLGGGLVGPDLARHRTGRSQCKRRIA
jgi:hypothetical protein